LDYERPDRVIESVHIDRWRDQEQMLDELLDGDRLSPNVGKKPRKPAAVERRHQQQSKRNRTPIGGIEPQDSAPHEPGIALRVREQRAREHVAAEHEEQRYHRAAVGPRTRRKTQHRGVAEKYRKGSEPPEGRQAPAAPVRFPDPSPSAASKPWPERPSRANLGIGPRGRVSFPPAFGIRLQEP